MNKWKVAFFTILLLFLTFTMYSIYEIGDKAITIAYMQEGYTDTEEDLDKIIEVLNNTDMSKNRIIEILGHDVAYLVEDTLSLNRIEMVFKGEELIQIRKIW